MDLDRSMDRREALKRAAILFGGALSAPTIAGVLAGDVAAWAATPDNLWKARTLTPAQNELVATLAEHIIPATDTPGARAAGVHRFVDALLTEHYDAAQRDRFLAGLEGVDVRARVRHKKNFVACTKREQLAILTAMDREAYPPKALIASAGNAAQATQPTPIVSPSTDVAGAQAERSPADVEGLPEPVRAELRSGFFWHRMKELTLTGYYTSQMGATQELRVNPMGSWQSDIPYRTVGHSWA
jgi:gluconate 2-dehydrogenase gamma chain